MTARADCLLAFDTAGGACSAAVFRDGRIRARRFEPRSRGHAERLLPMIQAVLADGRCDFQQLDAIAVTLGPGGFTGVRIGLSTARALALATGKLLIGLDSFAVVAAAVPRGLRSGKCLYVMIDAKRADVFVQAFDADLVPCGPARSLPPAAVAAELAGRSVVLAGDGTGQVAAAADSWGASWVVAELATHCDAAVLAELAASRPLPDPGTPPPDPLYLRSPDVTLPRDAAGR